jgi:hypothetical protein
VKKIRTATLIAIAALLALAPVVNAGVEWTRR